jgi:hypothetical protein
MGGSCGPTRSPGSTFARGGRDPALKSAIFVLEHPTGEQREWQVRVPNYDVMLSEEALKIGAFVHSH